MSKNKLFTLSYFRKRLRDQNIRSKILLDNESFSLSDKRYWMIAIFKDRNIICTCFKKDDDFEFHFSDGKQILGQDVIIKTESMPVIINFLMGYVTDQERKSMEEAARLFDKTETAEIPVTTDKKIKWVDNN